MFHRDAAGVSVDGAGSWYVLLPLHYYGVNNLRYIVILQLHRQFFTRALSGPEESFQQKHEYAPPVVAVFLSATRMIANGRRDILNGVLVKCVFRCGESSFDRFASRHRH